MDTVPALCYVYAVSDIYCADPLLHSDFGQFFVFLCWRSLVLILYIQLCDVGGIFISLKIHTGL